MTRRVLAVAGAVLAALLVVTAQPAAAADPGLAVASRNTTASDFAGASTLDGWAVSGSGASASASLTTASGSTTVNPVTNRGDGSTDNEIIWVGDRDTGTAMAADVGLKPDVDGTITEITPRIGLVDGADYGARVDVYVAPEAPDGSYGEGTLVKADWNPDWTTGRQSIPLDTTFSVTAGQEYSVSFVTQSSDGDGTQDMLRLAIDQSPSTVHYTRNAGGTAPVYGDLDVTIDAAQSAGTYVGATHDAEGVTAGFADIASLSDASATVSLLADPQGDGDFAAVNSTTVTAPGNVTLTTTTDADAWRMRIEYSTTGTDPAAVLDAEGVLFDGAPPSGSGADPTGQITSYDGDVSLNVSDPDFGLAQGDAVTATATNASGGQIGSTTITSNGTVSLNHPALAGSNEITWTLTDSYGASASVTQQFDTPGIRVLNASAPSQLVTGTNNEITVSFFGETDAVFRRTTTNGTVRLSGLPAAPEQGYQISVVDGADYESRQVVVDSLFEQRRVYLLPTSADTATVEFVLDDKTGRFDPETSTLVLERPISESGNTSFKTVFASEVGAGGAQRVVLENGQRYRIRVRSGSGAERALGSFDVSGPDTVELNIGQLTFRVADSPQTFNISADATASNGTVDSARLKYRDPTDQTSAVRVEFRNGSSNTTVASADSSADPVTQFAVTEQFSGLSAGDLTIAYEIDRGGETIAGSLRPGTAQLAPGIPLAPGLKQLFAVGLLLVVGGLFSARNAAVGAVVTPLFAAGLWFVAWLPPGVTILSIVLALGVGVIANIRTQS